MAASTYEEIEDFECGDEQEDDSFGSPCCRSYFNSSVFSKTTNDYCCDDMNNHSEGEARLSTKTLFNSWGPSQGNYYLGSTDSELIRPIQMQGIVWYLPDAVDLCLEGKLIIYTNGMKFEAFEQYYSESQVSFSWLPHSFVRRCVLRLHNCPGMGPNQNLHSRIFMVGLQSFYNERTREESEGKSLYFGILEDSETEVIVKRRQWMEAIASSMQQVTLSLFPHYCPISTAAGTLVHTRDLVLAGYLMHQINEYALRLVYAVLYPQQGRIIRLALYEDMDCRLPFVAEVFITPRTSCYEKMGYKSCCFVVDTYHFAARSAFERRLWLRAMCNLKVKVQSQAPYPAHYELAQWRESIHDHILAHDPVPKRQIEHPIFKRCAPPHISPLAGDSPLASGDEEWGETRNRKKSVPCRGVSASFVRYADPGDENDDDNVPMSKNIRMKTEQPGPGLGDRASIFSGLSEHSANAATLSESPGASLEDNVGSSLSACGISVSHRSRQKGFDMDGGNSLEEIGSADNKSFFQDVAGSQGPGPMRSGGAWRQQASNSSTDEGGDTAGGPT